MASSSIVCFIILFADALLGVGLPKGKPSFDTYAFERKTKETGTKSQFLSSLFIYVHILGDTCKPHVPEMDGFVHGH